ncbi:MAG: hypothetical protein JXB44_01575 [Calditrichaceae bacterium]|nr:hypothetical protein [Calditrichaceae bacterium]RQV97382.1 MAG: hypothetical protein EH224_01535 [Calditrichota bacterium]
MKRILSINLILCALIFQNVFAQFESTLEISSYFDDNLYRSPDGKQDFLTDFSLNIGYNLFEEKLLIYYNPDYFNYNESGDHNYFYHSFGFDYYNTFSNDQHQLYFGGNMDIRVNRDDFDYLNYNQYYAYLNLRFDLEFIFLKSGYNFRYRNYINYPDISNIQHYVFVQLNRSFATRTSIIFEANFGVKSFSGSESIVSTDTVSGGGGPGHGPGGTSTGERVYSTFKTLEPLDLSHAIILLRVAQSLHSNVGIYGQYRIQKDLSAANAYSSGGFYYQDEELFDDPFSYESHEFSSRLTWLMPWNTQVKLGGIFAKKNYISERAYLSAEDTTASNELRKDDRFSLTLELNKSFFIEKNWMDVLELTVDLHYLENTSNSYWYDYKNYLIGGSVRWSF